MTDHKTSARSSRPVVRDLRFAGTVAAGLIAGVLGVGAIAVPLVGWNDWPTALKADSGSSIVVTSPDGRSSTPSRDARGRTRTPARIGVVGPVAVSGTVLATTPGGLLAPAAEKQAGNKERRSGSREGVGGDSGKARPGGNVDTSTGFAQSPDSDNDNIADAYEEANGLTIGVNDASDDLDQDGVPNSVEYQLRTAANNADSNNDGVPDGDDDFDNDGVRNSVEVSLGTSPIDRADGIDDTDGDGVSNIDEEKAGTDPAVVETPPTPEQPPVTVDPGTDPTPVDDGTPAPVDEPATDPAPADDGASAPVEEPASDPAPEEQPAEPEAPVETPTDNSGDDDKDKKGPDQQAPVASPDDNHGVKPDPVAIDDAGGDHFPTDPPDTPDQASAAPAAAPPAPPAAAPPVQATPPTPPPAPVAPAPAAQVAPPAQAQTPPVQP
jgi:hypothetical protein